MSLDLHVWAQGYRSGEGLRDKQERMEGVSFIINLQNVAGERRKVVNLHTVISTRCHLYVK